MLTLSAPIILLRGGGDLASGVALRLHRAGFAILITEISHPLTVRRKASFSQAVFDGSCRVEEVEAIFSSNLPEALNWLTKDRIAVLVDPGAECRSELAFTAMVDGRMLKEQMVLSPQNHEAFDPNLFSIGLGPGFTARINCHAVVETNRGPHLGRVYWQGSAQPDTGIPEAVGEQRETRVLHAPADGILESDKEIGALLQTGDEIARVAGYSVTAPFTGVLRGLIQPGLRVQRGMKIGDLDPRSDPNLCFLASDKSLAVGGGVLEALLSQNKIRQQLGNCNEPG